MFIDLHMEGRRLSLSLLADSGDQPRLQGQENQTTGTLTSLDSLDGKAAPDPSLNVDRPPSRTSKSADKGLEGPTAGPEREWVLREG
jgi:hypothetical protein